MNATQYGLYKKMVSKASVITVEELKTEIGKLIPDTSGETDTVLNVLLTVLEGKISQAEYIAFLDSF